MLAYQCAYNHPQQHSRGEDGHGGDGVRGLKALGVRDLTYKLAFLCSSITPSDKHFNHWNIREDQEAEAPDDDAIVCVGIVRHVTCAFNCFLGEMLIHKHSTTYKKQKQISISVMAVFMCRHLCPTLARWKSSRSKRGRKSGK